MKPAFFVRLILCFDHHVPVVPVESCSSRQSDGESCVCDQFFVARPESSSQDSRRLRQVAAERCGKSITERFNKEEEGTYE
jgi:hypothetical protein